MLENFKIFDSLRAKKVRFEPHDQNNVKFYACGPTVYNYAHIGNARMAVVCDLLRNILNLLFKKVTFVSNVTDIDDKIIDFAIKENLTTKEVSEKFLKIYNQDMKALGVSLPDIQPKATDHVNEIIDTIKNLIEKKKAYVANKHVLFFVPSYEFYGALSKRSLDELNAGSRIEVESFKKHNSDFVLWKPSKVNEPAWDSPWGKGRPGWHIECSVMSEKTLGIPFDIHGGGADLKFPHHENEIAQSCSLGDKSQKPEQFSKYWFHNGFVLVNGEKMSKSLGNVVLVNDLIKDFSGEVIRFALLSAHYRKPLNWTPKVLDQAKKNLQKFYKFLELTKNIEITEDEETKYSQNMTLCILDDLNIPGALGILNSTLKKYSVKDKSTQIAVKANLNTLGKVLGLFKNNKNNTKNTVNDKLIIKLVEERNQARLNKDFKKADEIRQKLIDLDIKIEDKIGETTWQKK